MLLSNNVWFLKCLIIYIPTNQTNPYIIGIRFIVLLLYTYTYIMALYLYYIGTTTTTVIHSAVKVQLLLIYVPNKTNESRNTVLGFSRDHTTQRKINRKL